MCFSSTGSVDAASSPLHLNPDYTGGGTDLFAAPDVQCPAGHFISHLTYFYHFAPAASSCTSAY